MRKQIGKEIRDLRLKHDMSMKEFADKLGVTDSTVCRWENGTAKVSVAHAIKIADLFLISLDELVGR